MSKTAFDITVVLVDPVDKVSPSLPDLINGLAAGELEYYGESIHSENGRPIIYLTPKKDPA